MSGHAVKRPRPPWLRVAVVAVVIFLLPLVVGYPLVSYLAYNTLSLVDAKAAPTTPEGVYETVTFQSRAQPYQVAATFLPGDPSAPALIVVHGWRGDRFQMFPFGQALRGMGYNVLLPDLADAGGETVGNGRIAMGYEERFDVLGAFDYARDLGFAPERIGLAGASLGATTVLLTAGLEPRIRAVWADSPFARPDVVAAEQAETFGFPRLIVPGGLMWGMLLTGNRIWEAAAVEQAASLAANDQAVQLVHCTNDGFVFPHHSQDIESAYRAAGVPVDRWSLDCAEGDYSHAAAFRTVQDEYLRRLDTFFKTYLGD